MISALWLGWLVYWAVAALSAKPTRRRETLLSRMSHLIPLGLGAWLLIAPHGWRPMRARFLPPWPGWYWIGAALVMAGLALSVVARVWLGGNWSGTVTLKQGHDLIRTGPYRWVRHPIYTGLLLALIGSAVVNGRCSAVLGLACIAAAFLRKIGIEERFLTEQFGEGYARYRAEVPALLPFRL